MAEFVCLIGIALVIGDAILREKKQDEWGKGMTM